MKLKVDNGVIRNEDEVILGTVTDGAPREVQRTIELGSDLIPAVEEFINEVNTGKLRPRSAVKKFELIIGKYE